MLKYGTGCSCKSVPYSNALMLAGGGQSVWPVRRTAPCKAPLPGGSAVISMVRKSRGSAALVMGKVQLPPSGTWKLHLDQVIEL